MRRVSAPKQRLWVISALLVALVVRALIPAGFMPATDRPLSFQICPDGFPAALLGDATGISAGHEPEPATHHHHVDDGVAADFASGGESLAHIAHHHHTASDHYDGALAHHDDAEG